VHRGEFRFATEGNAVNPRIGSGLQYGRRVVEEQTVEVVENHEGGTRMGSGFPVPKGARRCGNALVCTRESDSAACTMEGRSLDNPMRGSPV